MMLSERGIWMMWMSNGFKAVLFQLMMVMMIVMCIVMMTVIVRSTLVDFWF
jgi:hypothetical protein